MNTLQSTYETLTSSVIPYSQTETSSITESSTSLVPASQALGLTDGSFTILAVTVIGILGLLPVWVTLLPRMIYRPKQAPFGEASLAGTEAPAPRPETQETVLSPGGGRIMVDRKEFEGFLAEEQKLVDRSQALMDRIGQLENENKRLGDELEATKIRLGSIESNITNTTSQADDSLRKAGETMSRLTKEADKRTSK